MTPDEHLAQMEEWLQRAEEVDKTPRSHLTRGYALLAIGHGMAALARTANAETGLTPGAYGRTTYLRVAGVVEKVAHAAGELLVPPRVRCPGCHAPTESGGLLDRNGSTWCLQCVADDRVPAELIGASS